ncbi:MAG: hypothetical protein EAZ78_07750 [Oscillatoriales cyanobacterium]|nr:MAG: hypothetical protein EA000_23465 [Oscillatoriales cyanobacterium]TAD96025.1 MAG: hypothetical protein EAZ98_13775 [Oscillatoriales cyanobacterium]TAE04717.1 MAG: hypothetical protein EAZ96_08140 [Oscillatoriales cyanobacterium]TAF04775.1 MAG: hypothetical protein EAZ78_07750 [Oscillatoriales cyanobacterium]TAF33864.1 MAG: hypothetical protein EAZ68_19655 [Oscillatoriales cyanobacterium]
MNVIMATLGTVVGLSSMLIGMTLQVLAQPRPQIVPPNSETTLSGDSLRTVEDRTLDSDYQYWLGEPQTVGDSGIRASRWSNTFRIKSDRPLDSIATPSDAERQANPLPPAPSDTGTGGGVKLQLGL